MHKSTFGGTDRHITHPDLFVFKATVQSPSSHPVNINTKCRPTACIRVDTWASNFGHQGHINPTRSPTSFPSGGDPSLQAQPGSITPRRAVKWPLCLCRHVGGMGLCVGRQPLPANNETQIWG